MSANQTAAARVALLVDGENITSALAGKLIVQASASGALAIKRVYGNAKRIPGWDAAPGLRLIHSGDGKNSADLLLTVQAMDIAAKGQADVFALASSDGDFAHLATHLREAGFQVIGLGEAKAPANFRKNCTRWVTLDTSACEVDKRIREEFRKHPGGLLIAQVNPTIRNQLNITVKDLTEPTWRAYFKQRSAEYDLTGSGQQTRITLR